MPKLGICSFCSKERTVNQMAGGKCICSACRQRQRVSNQEKWECCSKCSRHAHVVTRLKGKPICENCRLKQKKRCYVCRKVGTFYMGRCEACFRSNRKKESRCKSCGLMFEYLRKHSSICSTCYAREYAEKKPLERCFYCKKPNRVAVRLESGSPVCGNCRKKYHSTHKVCEMCGKTDYVSRNRLHDILVCDNCDSKIRYEAGH